MKASEMRKIANVANEAKFGNAVKQAERIFKHAIEYDITPAARKGLYVADVITEEFNLVKQQWSAVEKLFNDNGYAVYLKEFWTSNNNIIMFSVSWYDE